MRTPDGWRARRAEQRRIERDDERLDRYWEQELVLANHIAPKQMHGVCRARGCGLRGFLLLPAGTCARRCTPKLYALTYFARMGQGWG